MPLRMKPFLITAAALSLATASLALAAGHYVVRQSKLRFEVAELVMKKGSTITFKNNDRTSHNILVPKLSFNGGLQKPGEDISVAFARAGIYSVTCGIHPKMLLTVRVE